MLSKLVSVVGNVREPNLGLEVDVADVIQKEANIIVNSAATTNFRERYDVAIDINTRGPYLLMTFAKKCKKLELLLHVSTAYANGVLEQGRVMEEPLPMRRGESMAGDNCINHETPANPYPTLDIYGEIKFALDSVEDFKNEELTQKMKELGLERARKHRWQDVYTLTKAMGEMLIEENKGDIPVVIVRPSVVESTYREPFPGWIEGNRMVDPVILSYGKGELKGFPNDPNVVLDLIPVDMVVNAMLAAMTWHGSMAGKGDVNIYHIASSVGNPLLLQDLVSFFHDHFISTPWIDFEGRPIHVQPFKTFSSMDEFSADIWRHVIQQNGSATSVAANGKLPQEIESVCRKLVEKVKYLAHIYEPYSFYAGRFDNSNSQRLMESLSEEEKEMFGFDVKSIDWKDYIVNVHIPGLRTHVMKGKGRHKN